MTDKIEELIKEIAVMHGVAIGRDDPILILQTINDRLMEENIKTQKIMLDQYKAELEGIALQWDHEVKEKSERILNASLKASKEIMARSLQDTTIVVTQAIQEHMMESLAKTSQLISHAGRLAKLNLFACIMTLFIFIMVLIFQH